MSTTGVDQSPERFTETFAWIEAQKQKYQNMAPEQDPLAAARLRGLEAWCSMLEDNHPDNQLLTASEIAERLHTVIEEVELLRINRQLLAVQPGSGEWAYPAWQVREGKIAPRLKTALDTLAVEVGQSPITWLGFFSIKLDELNGMQARQYLWKGKRLYPLIRAIKRIYQAN